MFIQVLTGITDAMVAQAPRIESVLPAFLEFARDSVLVAHNAGFDVSFLKEAARSTGHPWPGFRVLDTVHLARQLVMKDESRNHKLSSLAVVFGATTTPDHRALHDARATVDVLHGLLERVGNLGVHTLEELSSYTSRVTPAQRRKRFLAEHLPPLPGVYIFKDERGRPLYVGTSRNIRARARSYFTASEQRTRMAEMVGLATSIQPIVCQTTLGGAGPRAAPHRRPQAALQPTFAEPRAGHLGQADPRAVPPALDRPRGQARRRPLPRPVPVEALRRGRRRRRPRGRAAAAVHRQALGPWGPLRVRARPDGPVRRSLFGAAVRRGVRGSRRRRDRPAHRRRPPGHRRAAGADGGPVGAGAVRGRRHGPRPAAPPRPRGRPDPAHRPAGRPARRSSRRGVPRPAGGSWSASATAGWPVPA